jgi:hypothetical protein
MVTDYVYKAAKLSLLLLIVLIVLIICISINYKYLFETVIVYITNIWRFFAPFIYYIYDHPQS